MTNQKTGFFKKWKEGIMNITAEQQLRAQMIGTLGNIFGIIFAMIFLILNGLWFFLLFLSFTVFLQFISYIGIKQKYNQIKMIMSESENLGLNENKEGE